MGKRIGVTNKSQRFVNHRIYLCLWYVKEEITGGKGRTVVPPRLCTRLKHVCAGTTWFQIFQAQIPRLPPKNMYISVLAWCVMCTPYASPTTAFHWGPYFLSNICLIAFDAACRHFFAAQKTATSVTTNIRLSVTGNVRLVEPNVRNSAFPSLETDLFVFGTTPVGNVSANDPIESVLAVYFTFVLTLLLTQPNPRERVI